MKNIVLVCLDYNFALKFSKKLSRVLQIPNYDADELIKCNLINSIDFPLSVSGDVMNAKEKLVLKELSEMENVIITLTDDEFVSNENYKLFSNSFLILLEIDLKNDIKKNIQNLIKKHCNYSENIKNLKINKLIKEIN